jgi:hypothetical protein
MAGSPSPTGAGAFLRAMYAHAQQRFKEAGATQLVIARGIQGGHGDEIQAATSSAAGDVAVSPPARSCVPHQGLGAPDLPSNVGIGSLTVGCPQRRVHPLRLTAYDEALVQEIRQSNYRFVLDLVQLEAEDEDNGPLDVKEKPWSDPSDQVKSWEPVRAS